MIHLMILIAFGPGRGSIKWGKPAALDASHKADDREIDSI
jgi:hypothetical protein